MGLDIYCASDDCNINLFHGSYGCFHRFRIEIVSILGYGHVFVEDSDLFDTEKLAALAPPLNGLMLHSDCDGSLSVEECRDLIPYFVEASTKLPEYAGPMSWSFFADGRMETTPSGITWKEKANTFLAGLQHCVSHNHEAVFC